MLNKKPLAVGFSVYEENINLVRAWASFAKSVKPDVVVVLGGPQIAFMPGTGLAQMLECQVKMMHANM
ncbi:MAG: cobalamin-dependent protein [Proteobacteria bacterium]|nr:cobalamin-dependent protein [Pseudomonadota bacterium]MBU1714689.1 cobalamin-dependent protein [Pseudomonadota bacterium]